MQVDCPVIYLEYVIILLSLCVCLYGKAIMYMLSTFAPSKGGWDVDDAENNRADGAPTLLDICAVNGNAEAVALLIQQGADLAKGVLQEIVIESVILSSVWAPYQLQASLFV